MKQFDFYEFTGILVPGVAILTGTLLLFPGVFRPDFIKDVSVGGLGLFVVLSYVLGHLVQAIGNIVEAVWWKLWGGMPTDWVRTKSERLLAPSQVALLGKLVHDRLGLEEIEIAKCTKVQWYLLTRQIYAEVSGAGRASRIDIFNGNYGLNRGIGASLLVVLFVAVFKSPTNWEFVGGTGIATALALYRMHRFARHYAIELFVQFLSVPRQEDKHT